MLLSLQTEMERKMMRMSLLNKMEAHSRKLMRRNRRDIQSHRHQQLLSIKMFKETKTWDTYLIQLEITSLREVNRTLTAIQKRLRRKLECLLTDLTPRPSNNFQPNSRSNN